MKLTLTEEQQMLVDAVAAFTSREYPAERRAALARAGGHSTEVWRSLADDLGVLGIGFDEEHSGVGGGLLELALVAREFGRCLMLEPFLESVVLAGTMLRCAQGELPAALAAGLITGNKLVVPALFEGTSHSFEIAARVAGNDTGGLVLSGSKSLTIAGGQADTLLVSARMTETDETVLLAIDSNASGVSRTDLRLIDGRSAADITFDGVRVSPAAVLLRGAAADQAIASATASAIAILAGEAIGVLEELLSATVEYTKQRQQFGVPIATFQALQHRMSEMHIEVEKATAATFRACATWPSDLAEQQHVASLLKAMVARALTFVGKNAIQLHGGIGTTDELFVSHHFRRATVLADEYGSEEHHLRKLAARLRSTA